MLVESPLARLLQAYLAARNAEDRLAALHQFRRQQAYLAARNVEDRLAALHQFRRQQPQPLPDLDAGLLIMVQEALLQHSRHDPPEVSLSAVKLVRDLWHGLSRDATDRLLYDCALSLLASAAGRHSADLRLVRETIDIGCLKASPAVVSRLCLELTARETSRCLLRTTGSALIPWSIPPVPHLDWMCPVVRYAPPEIWPRLVRSLWLLDSRLEKNPLLTPAVALIDRPLLRRTLAEAQPADLQDAAPTFFRWLEAPGWMAETDLEALFEPPAAWAVPPLIRVLQRWSHPPAMLDRLRGVWSRSEAFQHRAARAAYQLRARLGALGSEATPAAPPEGDGHEASPAGLGNENEPTPTAAEAP